MKKFSLVLLMILSALLSIVALAFCFIEGRMVFAGDWMLYQNKIIGLMQYLLRLCIAVIALIVGLLAFIKKKRANCLDASLCLTVICIVLAIFASNNFGLYFLILALLHLACCIFAFKMKAL